MRQSASDPQETLKKYHTHREAQFQLTAWDDGYKMYWSLIMIPPKRLEHLQDPSRPSSVPADWTDQFDNPPGWSVSHTHCQWPLMCYWKKFKVPYGVGEPIAYTKYKTENDLVFSGLDLGLADSSLFGRVDKHRVSKYGRVFLLDIDAYQQGQGLEETYATNTWYKLKYLKLTTQFTGEAEAFINQWDEGIEELRDIVQQPGDFTEKTLAKERIHYIDYTPVLDRLDMI